MCENNLPEDDTFQDDVIWYNIDDLSSLPL